MQPTDTYNIELETPFQELALNLGGNAIKADMAFGHYRIRLRRHHVRCGHRVAGFVVELLCDLSVVLVRPYGEEARELQAKNWEKGARTTRTRTSTAGGLNNADLGLAANSG